MADLTALRERTVRYGAELMREAERLMVNELREAAPLGETGDTRRGIEGSGGGGSALVPAFTVFSRSPHGDYVEEGRPARDIVPRNASVLRFLAGSGRVSQASPNQRIATRDGGVVFTKFVHQDAVPPRPWFGPVVDRFPDFIERAQATVQL